MEALGWHGKEFESPDRAQALVFRSAAGALIPVDPALLPVRIGFYLPRLAAIARAPGMGTAFSALLPTLRARRPTARLREREFRGHASSAMIYEAQPIVDHFRQIGDGMLLGLMDTGGKLPPYFFMLLAKSR